MKISHKIQDNLTIEVEGETQRDLFAALASAQEVFGEDTCGLCGKHNLVFRHRVVDKNDFYEVICKDCRGILAFGVSKADSVSLFPRRKNLKTGEAIGKYGWHKYNPEAPVVND